MTQTLDRSTNPDTGNTARRSTIEKTVFLSADKALVWRYLTDAALLGTWFHPARADLAPGEDFTLVGASDGDRMCWGKVDEAQPPDFMAWSFTVGPMQGVMSRVEWRLEAAPGGTRLSLTHSGLPDDAAGFGLVRALDKGWHGFLMRLIEREM